MRATAEQSSPAPVPDPIQAANPHPLTQPESHAPPIPPSLTVEFAVTIAVSHPDDAVSHSDDVTERVRVKLALRDNHPHHPRHNVKPDRDADRNVKPDRDSRCRRDGHTADLHGSHPHFQQHQSRSGRWVHDQGMDTELVPGRPGDDHAIRSALARVHHHRVSARHGLHVPGAGSHAGDAERATPGDQQEHTVEDRLGDGGGAAVGHEDQTAPGDPIDTADRPRCRGEHSV